MTSIFASASQNAVQAIPYAHPGNEVARIRVELAKRRARLDGLVVPQATTKDVWDDYSVADVDSWMIS